MFARIFKWGLITLVIVAGAALLSWVVIVGLLVFEHKRISNQGEIVDVLPDTRHLGDSTRVLFFRDKALFSIQLNGELERELYENVSEYHWSPDGKKLVLRTIGKEVDIVILDLDTGEAEVIERRLKCTLPEWSPDGKKLGYILRKNQLFIYDTVEATKTKIADAPSDYIVGVRWSTEGDSLFYNTLFTEEYFKYVVSTGDKILLSHTSRKAEKLDWYDLVTMKDIYFNQFNDRASGHYGRTSPDRRYRVYNKGGSMWIEKPEGNEMLVVFKGIHNVDFSQPGITEMEWLPNNEVVLFNFRGRVYAVHIETKKAGFLTTGDNPMAYIPHFRPADLEESRPSIMYDYSIHMRDRV